MLQIPSHITIFVYASDNCKGMKIKLISVGKTDREWLRAGLGLYLDRLRHYIPLEFTEIPDIRNTAAMTRETVKAKEGELILKQIAPGDHVVLLDERGKEMTSAELAKLLEDRISLYSSNIVFVIGGPYGFSEAVYGRSNAKLSLSRMTFSHQMARVIFAEQLYRAFTIIRGEPYHHE